jgi:ribosomal protein L21
MRKILTVLCLALALCLLCGYALAANDPYGDSHFESVDALDALKDGAYKDIGKVEGHEDLTEKTKTAKCGEYVEVDVYGTTTQGTETKTVHAKAYVILKAHTWVNASTSEKWDVAPTCTEKGKDNKQCSNCKAVEFVKDIDALGHAFELAYAEGKEPTCTKDGAKIMTCIRCKVTDGEEIKVDKLAHNYNKLNFTEPKCAPNDQSTGAAAIMKDGQYYYTCSVCGKKEVTVDAEGKETEVAAEVVTLKQYQEGFTDKKNTATKPIKAPEGYDGHDWTEWLPTKAATCTAYAKERRFCKRCTMEEWREDKESGYADHKFDVDSSKPFNCKTTANDVTVYCTTESTATNKVLPAGYTKVIVDEVVSEDNVTVSPKVLQVKDPKGNVVYEFALPHSWKVALDADKKEIRTKATCTEAATVTMECEICKTRRVLKEGKPLGHDLSDWKKETDTADSTVWNRVCNRCHKVAETYVGKVPPCRESEHNYVFDDKYVCGEEKVYKYTCSVCGMATTKKEKFDHDYSKNVVKVATCKEDGIEIWTCKLCNETLVKYPSHTEVEHTWIEVPAVEKTCTVDGKTAGKVCSVCGVIDGCEVVKAPGQHTYKVVEGKAATCTEKGLSSSVKCSVCGETLMAATEIEALGHDFVDDAAVAATCTKAGKEAGKHCTRCDYTEGGKEIKALGHKWDEGKVTKEATPDEKGEKLYTCTVCGEKRTEEFEFVATEDPKYEVKDAEYDGDEGVGIVSGKVAHDPYTKDAGTTYARVTFFMADGSFVAFATVIDEDGNFEAMTSGEVVHIAVQITDSTKVRPGEFDSFGSTEFDVE